MSNITELAARQLSAYNAADLDGFCACYHPDIAVYDGETESLRGITAFRERYVDTFTRWSFGASVDARVSVGTSCVDHERYWRVEPATGERTEGEVLVRYTERDGQIGLVQFLR